MIAVGFAQFLILLVALVRGKALALLLGPEGVGVVGTVDQFVITIAQLTALGLPFAAMKFMSASHATGGTAFQDAFASFARVIFVLAGSVGVLSIGLVALAPELGGELAAHRDVVLISLLSVPMTILTIFLAHTFAAAQMPRAAAFYNLLFAAAVAAAALTGVVLEGLWSFYLGSAIGGFLVVFGALAWLRRKLGLSLLRRGSNAIQVLSNRSLVVRTAVASYTTVVSYSLILLIVRFAVLQDRGEAEVGYLQSALSVAMSVGSILTTMSSLYIAPQLNRVGSAQEKFIQAERFADKIAYFMVLGGVPVALLPGLVLWALFSGAFIEASVVLVLCLVWQALFQLMTTYAFLLIGVDRPLASTFATLLSVGIGIATVYVLVADLGMLAAPIALMTTAVVRIAAIMAILVLRDGMPFPWMVLFRFASVCAVLIGPIFLFEQSVIVPEFRDSAFRAAYFLLSLGIFWLWLRDRI